MWQTGENIFPLGSFLVKLWPVYGRTPDIFVWFRLFVIFVGAPNQSRTHGAKLNLNGLFEVLMKSAYFYR